MPYEPLYRKYSYKLSKDRCASLLTALAKARAITACQSVLRKSFPESESFRWEMLFKLKFSTQSDLDYFHSLSLTTTPSRKIGIPELNHIVNIKLD